jgi:uncharacterized repeat protein (TIGR01451 family)
MKTLNKKRFIPVLLTLLMVFMMAIPAVIMAAPPAPITDRLQLGAAENFAVLGHSTVTNTGSSEIIGDLGLSPGTSVTGFAPIDGGPGQIATADVYIADTEASNAQAAALSAYTDAANRPYTQDLTGKDLGSVGTLGPGVYKFSSDAGLTGNLTLDDQGNPEAVFIFQIGSALTTASNSSFTLAPGTGTKWCRVFWQVGSSATLGTGTSFVGHILAHDSITANTSATVQGQLLALNYAVTLDTNNITNIPCENTTGSLQVTKEYSGGTPPSAGFDIIVNGTTKTVNADNNWTQTWTLLPTGNYPITENSLAPGWTMAAPVSATVVGGATVEATITNNYSSGVVGGGGGGSSSLVPPLINVIKTPAPLALTSGQGLVTYTYKVSNPGTVALSNVSVTDDKVSPVTYVSGDINADHLLQPSETWIYAGTTNLTATTTNTATAKGSANGMTATHIALATVVVTTGAVVYPPLINVTKIPSPLALTTGPGSVTYTYKVTNPGVVALSNVSVTDDKVSPVTYVSGDVNGDHLLQPGETWIYTSQMNLNASTTNTATAKGSANGLTAVDIAFATVVVTQPVVVTPAVVGTPTIPGKLPNTGTGTPLYELFLIAAALTLVATVGWRTRKRYQ